MVDLNEDGIIDPLPTDGPPVGNPPDDNGGLPTDLGVGPDDPDFIGPLPTDGDPPETEPPPFVEGPDPDGVPDYSGEADDIKGDGGMEYTVPDVADVDTPISSGTADPSMTPWEVTDEQTVQGQLTDLYDRDSPFFEQARQRAIRQHLGSGGQNSAMAGAFGELAAMDTAFKVGFADAQTYARSAEFNAGMANQFSLAEQRFIHNAMLSDQAFDQASALQTQRVEAQLESIVLDYKGRGMLMDKELDQYFLKAKQDYAYQLGIIGAQTNATLKVNAMQAISNFYIAGFQSVMEMANNPNFTPEQSQAAMRNGMAWFNAQAAMFKDFQLGGGNPADYSSTPSGSWLDAGNTYNPAYNWGTWAGDGWWDTGSSPATP